LATAALVSICPCISHPKIVSITVDRISVAAYVEEGVLQRILSVAPYAEEHRPLGVHGLSVKRSYTDVC
jgi:hypothetical protein